MALENTNKNLFLHTFTDESIEICESLLNDDSRDLLSVKQVKPLSEQRSELDRLAFDLKNNAEILGALITNLYKLEDSSKQYIDALENISHFANRNIIDSTKQVIDDLNSVLEYETNPK